MHTNQNSASEILARNDLIQEARSFRIKAFLASVVTAGSTFGLLCVGFDITPLESNQSTVLSTVVLGVLFKGTLSKFLSAKRLKAIDSGAKGERFVAKRLAKLPFAFAVRNHVLFPNPHSRTGHTEADFVVVGRNGVYLVEAKNNAGKVAIDESKDQWSITLGKNHHSMRNPIKQVSIQKSVLERHLRAAGLNVDVKPLVVMSNPDVKLKGQNGLTVPVFKYPAKSLARRIKKMDRRANGSGMDADKVAELIDKLNQQGQLIDSR